MEINFGTGLLQLDNQLNLIWPVFYYPSHVPAACLTLVWGPVVTSTACTNKTWQTPALKLVLQEYCRDSCIACFVLYVLPFAAQCTGPAGCHFDLWELRAFSTRRWCAVLTLCCAGHLLPLLALWLARESPWWKWTAPVLNEGKKPVLVLMRRWLWRICETELLCESQLHMIQGIRNTHPFYKQGFTIWQGKSHCVAMLLPVLEQQLERWCMWTFQLLWRHWK